MHFGIAKEIDSIELFIIQNHKAQTSAHTFKSQNAEKRKFDEVRNIIFINV